MSAEFSPWGAGRAFLPHPGRLASERRASMDLRAPRRARPAWRTSATVRDSSLGPWTRSSRRRAWSMAAPCSRGIRTSLRLLGTANLSSCPRCAGAEDLDSEQAGPACPMALRYGFPCPSP